jgi:hypothetical protein
MTESTIPETEVEGTPRTIEQAATMLHATGESLWSMVLAAHSPRGRQAFEWMKHPRPGDLVLVWLARAPDIELVGTWVAGWTIIFGPDAAQDETTPYRALARDEVYMVELLDGSLMRWTNVELLRLPRNDAEYREMTR